MQLWDSVTEHDRQLGMSRDRKQRHLDSDSDFSFTWDVALLMLSLAQNPNGSWMAENIAIKKDHFTDHS